MENQLRAAQELCQRQALEIQRLAEIQQDNARAVQAHVLFRELAQLLERLEAIKRIFLDWRGE